MSVVHFARARVYQEKRPNRRAYLGDFPEPIRYGVNSGIKDFYKMEPEEELPATLDHLVGAAAGWLTGTLAGALEARGIPSHPDKLWTEAEGSIEAPERVMKLTTMRVKYHLKIPKGRRADAERALAVFERGCPVAQTLKGCVEISHAWEITEEWRRRRAKRHVGTNDYLVHGWTPMTYVFRCASCRHEFEIIATVAEYESRGLPACPKCGKAAAKRVFTPVMVMTGARGASDAGDLPSGGGCCGGGACGCGHVH